VALYVFYYLPQWILIIKQIALCIAPYIVA